MLYKYPFLKTKSEEDDLTYEQTKLDEIVTRAVEHRWSIPEFQRGFVWKSTQVRDLAESLWLDYPIGSLLIWNSSKNVEEKVALDAQRPSNWLVDGQQRTTALCILFGRKPYWWSDADSWNKILKRYDIRFDIHTKEPPFFWVANAGIRKTKGNRYVKVSELLNLDIKKEDAQRSLNRLAKEIKDQGLCDGMDAMEVYTRLDRVRKIREKEVVTITVDHELEDVVEIFARLNSQGTRVTEADIYLGIVASKNPGWVRSDFLPYHEELSEAGFKINPNLLFRSITAIGENKSRFVDVSDKFWEAESILPAWRDTKNAWKRLIKLFRDFGILSNSLLPTETALVTMVSLLNKFKDATQFKFLMYWFLQASRLARYSSSAFTSLDEDLREIKESRDLVDAVTRLLTRIKGDLILTNDDFMQDYTDTKFGRLMLYLLIYRNKALDWDENSNRIGFEGVNVLSDYQPQWHHIFPQKYLKSKVSPELIDTLANIAVIGPQINIRISAKAPLDYVNKYKITNEKLLQQFIDPDFVKLDLGKFESWLRSRAEVLRKESNSFLEELMRP